MTIIALLVLRRLAPDGVRSGHLPRGKAVEIREGTLRVIFKGALVQGHVP